MEGVSGARVRASSHTVRREQRFPRDCDGNQVSVAQSESNILVLLVTRRTSGIGRRMESVLARLQVRERDRVRVARVDADDRPDLVRRRVAVESGFVDGVEGRNGAVFRELDQLRRGDDITVWAQGESQDYAVHDVLIVPEKYATPDQRSDNAHWIGSFNDNRLTLVSCWPRDDNTHRIIVVAFPKQ